jgi:hypothetical protein
MYLLQRPASEVPSVSEVSLGGGGCASISQRAPFISAVIHGDCEAVEQLVRRLATTIAYFTCNRD